jgi:hypothetical protein
MQRPANFGQEKPMKMTRTQFVSTLATAAAATLLDPGDLFAQAVRAPAGFSAARFQPYLNTSFYAQHETVVGAVVVELVLTEVETKSASGLSEQFTLRLLAVNGYLEEGTYTLEHRSLGSIPLFLGAGGPAPTGHLYRADFNILKRTLPRASS